MTPELLLQILSGAASLVVMALAPVVWFAKQIAQRMEKKLDRVNGTLGEHGEDIAVLETKMDKAEEDIRELKA